MSIGVNRRLTLRVEPPGSVAVLDLNCPEAATLVDLSLGGFLLCGHQPYPLDATSEFLFEDFDGRWNTRLAARVVHSHPRDASEQADAFMTGFAFVDGDDPSVQSRIAALFERVASATLAADSATRSQVDERWPFARLGGLAG